ncbi:sensor histidine kinase [Flavihumibacter sp. UBA7668]|uniref:sensor histidine kinase n=1 Tax=Flavihumibacter sp. UBA7668 TaxID=1946542 RepID=UPI0025C6C568|nr:ATP-binding protein [Flavihumibacter sp. UBA7668]
MVSIFQLYRIERKYQYLYSIGAVLLVAGTCFVFSSLIDYHIVAFLLLVTVSLAAVSFDIKPVLVAALLSALLWDLFFIPPKFSYAVTNPEDLVLLLMYFIIVLINAVLTYRIRQVEKLARQRSEKAREIQLYNTILNSLSHELRTPISTIIGASDNLQENKENLSEANKSILLSQISEAAVRLNHQVENLLNMSRLEAGQLQPKAVWVDLPELLYGLDKKAKEADTKHALRLVLQDELPMVKLDKIMLEQILFNLLTNAQAHTPDDTKIELTCHYKNGQLELTIEDNGTGFPMDERELVFDRFYRLKNTAGSGTGLGLSIVKGFTEALGGEVLLSNSSSGGALFTIRIPAAAAVNLPIYE